METLKQLFKGKKSSVQGQLAEEPVESPLSEALLSAAPDGPTLYVRDRSEAFQWYRNKGFPPHDHKSEVDVEWYTLMSRAADQKGIWQEAWAGFHHALAGRLALKRPKDIPEICWRLGRAHTALGRYDLASLYFRAGRKLSEQQNNTELASRILLEEAVLATLVQQPGNYQSAMEPVLAALFPSGQASTLADKAAMTLFQEGMTNHQWRDDRGQPIKSCLIHASGLYRVSLEINRKLGNKQGIAITLVNLGDVWRKLGQKKDALACWREALTYLSELGDQKSIGTVNQWMSEV
jgi:tetratricopeptide (TPR) repeat protein